MKDSERVASEVLDAFKKVSPSKIMIEDGSKYKSYKEGIYNLFFHRLKFPPRLFKFSKVLDLGCGTGEVDIIFSEWGANVVGVDFNDESIIRAKKLADSFSGENKPDFFCNNLFSTESDKECYDIVTSLGVIPHVADQRRMFELMCNRTKSDGFIILGFVEQAGLIQRLLHRAICKIYDDGRKKSDVYRIAKHFFSEHINRSVDIGGRSAESVINDYLVNPHYFGLDIHEIMDWASEKGMEFYSSCPEMEAPFLIDSPYFKGMDRGSDFYRGFLSLHELRWIYAQSEDEQVLKEFGEILKPLTSLSKELFHGFSDILQKYDLSEESVSAVDAIIDAIEKELERGMNKAGSLLMDRFSKLNTDMRDLLHVLKEKKGSDTKIDESLIPKRLFRGYNGLGTSYVVFHKK